MYEETRPLQLPTAPCPHCGCKEFLIWQGAYSEWYFPPTFWPDFDRKELLKALEDFNQRERRYGLTTEQLKHKKRHAR